MSLIDINQQIPISNIIIMILIISANWMKPLFPCKFQNMIDDNIYIRHIFGYFTMTFFVVLLEKSIKFNKLFINSLLAYIVFLFMIRTPSYIFIVVLILLLILYILKLKKNEYEELQNTEKQKKYYKYINDIIITSNIITILIYLLIIIGSFIYLVEQRDMYKDNFSFIKFLIGNNTCNY